MVIDAKPKSLGLPTEAYIMVEEVHDVSEKFTVNFLNIWTPKEFVVITLKFELCGSTIE